MNQTEKIKKFIIEYGQKVLVQDTKIKEAEKIKKAFQQKYVDYNYNIYYHEACSQLTEALVLKQAYEQVVEDFKTLLS